jgi:SAM-dependent methyltransferase
MTDPASAPWWRDYFDEDFIRLYRPFLPRQRTRREVAGLLRALELPVGGRVLDLACGWGRHAVELARLGYRVCAIDRSATLLRHAQRRAHRAGVEVGWVLGDVRELPWRDCFDAVVCLFSSLGYFLSDAEDLRALRAVHGALRPGGSFLLETMHRDAVVRELAERDWWQGAKGEHVWVEREFDALEGISHEWLRWRTSERLEGEKYHAIRIRTATEWKALLEEADLEPEAWFGGWQGRPFTHLSSRLIVRATRSA